ncbi:UDP-N-acetylglucosamine 4-epimerase (UDP-GlcNAc 4-epimerase) [Escherichia coli]|nr:UDP-N-acetylglucosamine 4-epimerase (UDP-GlcNAc 4-epimerase) [Escherichia coli]
MFLRNNQTKVIMNDNVLLIGASGFVGTRLLETAIADFNIKNLDKQQSHFYPEITQMAMFVINRQLDQALAGFDTVVLLAAETAMTSALLPLL